VIFSTGIQWRSASTAVQGPCISFLLQDDMLVPQASKKIVRDTRSRDPPGIRSIVQLTA